MTISRLPRLEPEQVGRRPRAPVDPETLRQAAAIVEEVRAGGESALRRHAARLGDIDEGDSLIFDRDELARAAAAMGQDELAVLKNVAARIESFANAQRGRLHDLDTEIPGGRAGHRWIPVRSVGAYAPGGLHPLPSSVLMTVIPAMVAGVEHVWVASPHPAPVIKAAAHVAGADGLVGVGGAQAIAALAFGTVSPACDLIVGPGNRWVTAAKKHLYGEVGIDGLAGPSEILVLADAGADPALVAADLLAQAEHDTDAIPMLISTSVGMADAVDAEIGTQLEDLPTSETAAAALRNGFSVVVDTIGEGVEMCNSLAPEHLALHVASPEHIAEEATSFGSLFVGWDSAETFADYGAGPNHVLPTGGTARFQSGLSVLTYLRSPTWSRLDHAGPLVEDTVLLARMEGLEAHARAARRRSPE
jgi:histidinol dehydrogenase